MYLPMIVMGSLSIFLPLPLLIPLPLPLPLSLSSWFKHLGYFYSYYIVSFLLSLKFTNPVPVSEMHVRTYNFSQWFIKAHRLLHLQSSSFSMKPYSDDKVMQGKLSCSFWKEESHFHSSMLFLSIISPSFATLIFHLYLAHSFICHI